MRQQDLRYLLLAAGLTVALAVVSVAYSQDGDSQPPTASDEQPLQPEGQPVEPTAPDLAEGIQIIPLGSLVLLPPAWVQQQGLTSDRWNVATKSFLLPGPYYDTALTKAKQLDVCRPALDECTDTSIAWMGRATEALASCDDVFDQDEQLIQELTTQVGTQETRATTAELKLHRARTAAGVSWAITGGIVAGLVTAAIVATAGGG